MANLVPTPTWSDVFQLETTTQVLGGPGGVSNRQAQELLNRTEFLDGSTGSSRIGFVRSEAGALARKVQDKLRDSPSVKDFGAIGDNSTPDQAAFVAAANAASHVIVPAGIYKFTANTTVNCALTMYTGAILAPDAGVTITLVSPFSADRSQHIQGAGTVVFAAGSVDNVAAEWFGLSRTGTEVNNTAALQKAWIAGFGTYVTVGRGAFPLGDTEVKAYALSNTSQLPNGLVGAGVDGNAGTASPNVGTTFVGNSARIHFLNDAVGNSDAKFQFRGFHIVGPNDNVAGVGGIKITKMSNFVLEDTQVTGSRGHGYELIKCYGAVVQKNTALSNRQYGFLCNQQFNQACLRDNKSIGNGKDYTGIYANIAFSGGPGLESLAPVIENNDVSYAGANAVLYRLTNPSPGPNSIGISSVVVSGFPTGICTVTTAAAHGRTSGDYISLYGVTSNIALNTDFTPQITVTGTNTFTFPTSAPNGSYTDSTIVIGPAAYGATYNDMRGAKITHYGEDCIGVSLYVGANAIACRISGGYNQGFNTAGGGNGVIVIDNPTNVSVAGMSLSGANSRMRVVTSERKHGVNIDSSVTAENGATIIYSAIRMVDGEYYASAPPAAGTWAQGDWVHNLNAAPGQPQFWYCSAAPLTFVAIDGAAGGGASLPPLVAGQFLTNNGTVTSWAALPTNTIPSFATESGKVLSNNGSILQWVAAGAGGLPTQSGSTVNKYLRSDGTNASWQTPTLLSDLSANMGAITAGSIATSGNIAAGNLSATGTTTTSNLTVTAGISTVTINCTGNATVSGTLSGVGANFSGTVAAAGGHSGGPHSGTTGNFTGGFVIGGGLTVSGGGMSVSGSSTIAAFSGTSLTVPAPGAGTGLRCTTAGGGSTALTIDGSSGGTALYVIGSMRLDLAFGGGSSLASTAFLAAKPGNPTDGLWMAVTVNGIAGHIPFWPQA